MHPPLYLCSDLAFFLLVSFFLPQLILSSLSPFTPFLISFAASSHQSHPSFSSVLLFVYLSLISSFNLLSSSLHLISFLLLFPLYHLVSYPLHSCSLFMSSFLLVPPLFSPSPLQFTLFSLFPLVLFISSILPFCFPHVLSLSFNHVFLFPLLICSPFLVSLSSSFLLSISSHPFHCRLCFLLFVSVVFLLVLFPLLSLHFFLFKSLLLLFPLLFLLFLLLSSSPLLFYLRPSTSC